jgi:hypothetical protein
MNGWNSLCVYEYILFPLYSNYLLAIELNVHVRVPTLETAVSENFMYSSSDWIGLDLI